MMMRPQRCICPTKHSFIVVESRSFPFHSERVLGGIAKPAMPQPIRDSQPSIRQDLPVARQPLLTPTTPESFNAMRKRFECSLTQLPLKSRQELRLAHPSVASQPVPAIPHLAVHRGWSCRLCNGLSLTTSEVVRNRRAAAAHHLRPRSHNEDEPLWESCELQTIFAVTGDVQFFRICSSPIHNPTNPNSVEAWVVGG